MTFNPWIGCTKVSPGCAHCYAERDFDLRKHVAKWGAGQPRHRTSEAYWKQPLKWDREAVASGIEFLPDGSAFRPDGWHRPRVFCASLADWLDDEVPIEWLADLLDLIRRTPNLDWLLLTKRPENWERRVASVLAHEMSHPRADDGFGKWLWSWLSGHAPANVWIGTTVENQQTADERLPHLKAIPARVRFISGEPLLEGIDLRKACSWGSAFDRALPGIHWVICGGESGPAARPMHPDWARSLRDQCAEAGVPFLFKQWGEWSPREMVEDTRQDSTLKFFPDLGMTFARVGKHAAGRMLDGREHNQFPEAREQ